MEKVNQVNDRVLYGINRDYIVFDDYSRNNKRIFKLSNNMKRVISDSFASLCEVAGNRYSVLFEKKSYDNYEKTEELIDGPVKFIVYNNQDYPEGYVHRIDAENISYSMVPSTEEIMIKGSYNYFYTKSIDYYRSGDTPHKEITDILGIMNYTIYVNEDGYVYNILVEFRTIDKDRGTNSVLADRGYIEYSFDTMQDFFAFKEKLKDYDFAMNLFGENKVDGMSSK